MAIRKAQRAKAKLRLGISGPAGSGKTMGSLLVAYGITSDWENICLIDTENGSGDLYAGYNQNNISIGEYNIISINAPYSPDKYISAIKECESAGIEVVIIDSLTHAWDGEGRLLDKKGQLEKKSGNGWAAWRDVTPLHNSLVESILQSKCHIIATLRAKMEHVQEKDEYGKTVIRKIGLKPIQRDGMEYEFTVFMDVDQQHLATSSKDRTSLFDGKSFTLAQHAGALLKEWLETGIEAIDYKKFEPINKKQIREITDLANNDLKLCSEVCKKLNFASWKDILDKDFEKVKQAIIEAAEEKEKQSAGQQEAQTV